MRADSILLKKLQIYFDCYTLIDLVVLRLFLKIRTEIEPIAFKTQIILLSNLRKLNFCVFGDS